MIVAPIITIVSGLVIAALLIKRNIDLQKGKIFYNGDGLLEFSENSKELFIYIKKVFKHLRKVFIQYTFHFFVRVLYYLRNFFDTIYTYTRNKFMNVAIKDKKAVSRFWTHLKEYKQEVDKEKQPEKTKNIFK